MILTPGTAAGGFRPLRFVSSWHRQHKLSRLSSSKASSGYSSSDFTVTNIETTGLDPKYDSIIEIAAIRYRDDRAVAEFSTLINPGFPISDYISSLTGITNEMLSSVPALADVLPCYLEFVGDDILLGHNVNFDINFLYDAAVNLELPTLSNDFIDTMRMSRRLFPEFPHHRLADLVFQFHIEQNTAHRALFDCYATADCYQYMKEYTRANKIRITTKKTSVRKYSSYPKSADIATTVDIFDESHPLYGKNCVFTGTLQQLSRATAMQAVVDVGGVCQDRVTKTTNFLILGNNDYCKAVKDGKSTKQKKAEQYKLAGQDIEIISEGVFYDLLQADISLSDAQEE